jgi:hypothetical protein
MLLTIGFFRSGNTWMMRTIASLIGCGTIDTSGGYRSAQAQQERKAEILKAHSFSNNSPASAVFFALRNYREAVVRHAQHSKRSDMECFLLLLEQYMVLLREFDRCSLPKILIRYEDMMTDNTESVRRISQFTEPYGSSAGRCEEFLKHLAEHQQESLKQYGGSKSGSDFLYYSKLIGPKQCRELDEYAKKIGPVMFDKYLIRYAA